VLTFKRERIKDLHLITTVRVKTTIPSTLTPSFGLVRSTKFNMDLEVTEGLLTGTSLHQQTVLTHSTTFPEISSVLLSIKENHSTFRGLGTQC
jgi:hypothetical protein